jgi:hypothetical protein
VGQRDRF